MKKRSEELGINCFDHSSFEDFREAIEPHAIWFAGLKEGIHAEAITALGDRLAIHRFEPAECLILSDPRPGDIEMLGRMVIAAYLRRDQVLESEEHIVLGEGELANAACRLIYPYRHVWQAASTASRTACISPLEFLLSSGERLAAYPAIVNSRANDRTAAGVQAVFMLELIQDIEILKPLILRAALPDSPFNVTVTVSKRILDSVHGARLTHLLESLHLPWIKPDNPCDIAGLLGNEKSLLVTASESNASGHRFAHEAVKSAPPRAVRVTMQHGYECIGLRHHPAHDNQFKRGVRFASDIILTWQTPDRLPNLHPLERHKAIPVGVCKGFAEASSLLHDERWGADPGGVSISDQGNGHSGVPKLLVAENLHSVRFSTVVSRYQRFFRFILDAQASPEFDLTVRSHPGKRTLEKNQKRNRIKFLEGSLTPEDFSRFDLFVSPPSTIILDAILTGLPSLVWSDAARLGDIRNYRGLEVVTDIEEIVDSRKDLHSVRSQLTALKWAANNTSAFNGVPQAWSVLRNLAA